MTLDIDLDETDIMQTQIVKDLHFYPYCIDTQSIGLVKELSRHVVVFYGRKTVVHHRFHNWNLEKRITRPVGKGRLVHRYVGGQILAQRGGTCRKRFECMDFATQGCESPRKHAPVCADVDGNASTIAKQIEQMPLEFPGSVSASPE